MPLVLVSNDANASKRYAWKDITGVQYHYPNGYRNIIRTGEPFVYYRGVRRATGSRGEAEYFGQGVIGDIWRDSTVPATAPKAKWAWFCEIEDYVPFVTAIPAKIDGVFFESIKPNQWRNGVRKISQSAFDRILTASGVSVDRHGETSLPVRIELPPLSDVEIEDIPSDLILALSRNIEVQASIPNDRASHTGGGRRSRNAKIAGDRSEGIAIRYIRERVLGATNIRHVASAGETPGWDIEYRDADGNLNAIEVKGTSGDAFISFEMTDNELAAARNLGQCYWIYLIAKCLGRRANVHAVRNPFAKIEQGQFLCRPSVWRLSRSL